MSWIKRNLYFLIGSIVALVLLGLAGFYFYSKWDLNNKNLDQLNQAYEDLKKLNAQNPHPGSGSINNTEIAKEQIKEYRAAIAKTFPYFNKIPRIPDLAKPTDSDFFTALAQTIAQLTRDATNNSVLIQTNYNFSFQAQRNKMGFAAGSLQPLSVQLGEVKALCDILFAAKVNSLDYIRRERVSPDDAAGSPSDYLAEKSVTNALAVLTPYEISFHGFSPELAAVLSGLARSPYGFVVQFVNVEPSAVTVMEAPPPPVVVAPIYSVAPVQPSVSQEQAFRDRYGLGPGGGRLGEGGDAAFRSRYGLSPGGQKFPQPVPQPQPVAVAPGAAGKPGLQTVIDEKQLKVTIMVNVVKMIAPASGR